MRWGLSSSWREQQSMSRPVSPPRRNWCSPYASAIVPVRKKNGSIRICIDYPRLNAKTIRDSFPLPRIQESLEALHGSMVFSSLDLAHRYIQVVMEPDSVPMTAFRVP